MFKLVVLSALLAAALAEPAADPQLFFSRAAYTATIPTAVSTAYVHQARDYFPAASVYSALPYAHLIKKRSPQFFGDYFARSGYIAGAPLVTPYTSSYLAHAPLTTVYPPAVLPAHLIKKRSAQLIAAPASYIAPAAPIASSYIASAPLAYSSSVLPYSGYYPYSFGFPYFKK